MHWRRCLLIVTTLLAGPSEPLAQHNHAQHHEAYQNWVNNDNRGCCNNRDCGEIADDEHRVASDGSIEVRVRGVGVAASAVEWCPVLAKHYLREGNAPNWSTAHICVSDYYQGKTPCEQFICYQPKPMY